MSRQQTHVHAPTVTAPPLREREGRRGDAGTETAGTRSRSNGDSAPPNLRFKFGQVAVHATPSPTIQLKLVVGEVGDAYEQEADRVANQVMAGESVSAPISQNALGADQLRRQPDEQQDEEEDDEKDVLQANALPNQTPQVTSSLANQLTAAQGQGQPLPHPTRQFFESRFGQNLNQVRVHTDAPAATAANTLRARAFTHQQDIFFGDGYYEPETPTGKWLLAHELTHTLQRRPGIVARQPVDVPVAPPQTRLEHDTPLEAIEHGIQSEGAFSETPPVQGAAQTPIAEDNPPERGVSPTRAELGTATRPEQPEAQPAAGGQTRVEGTSSPAVGADAEGASEGEEASGLEQLATGNLGLIDEELAEHQRWGAAAAQVGAAGSTERAQFVLQAIEEGAGSGITQGLGMGLAFGAGGRAAEMAVARGAGRLAASAAARLGTQAVRFTPLPAVGAVIGGALSAYNLASRNWGETGETIGRFGQGASIYEQLANSIAAVSEIIDVATNILNVIAGVIGAISIAMWIITVLTVGIASPLAATLSAIAVGIGIGTMILDGINAVVLQRLVLLFRALHAFTSQADPRDVLQQSVAISAAAGKANGFLGGLAGGITGSGAAGATGRGLGRAFGRSQPTPPHPNHPTPSAAAGDGPTVRGEPPVEGATTSTPERTSPAATSETTAGVGEAPTSPTSTPEGTGSPVSSPETAPGAGEAPTAPQNTPEGAGRRLSDDPSFADINDVVDELNASSFGDRLAAEAQVNPQAPPLAPPNTNWRARYRDLRRSLRQETPPLPGAPREYQGQHWTKWLDSTRDLPPGTPRMHPDVINQNRSWLQSRKDRPATLLLTDPNGGPTRYMVGDRPFDFVRDLPDAGAYRDRQLSLPGLEPSGPSRVFQTEHKFADNYLIPEMQNRIRSSNPAVDPNQANLWAGGMARWMMEGTPGQGNWGWQPASSARSPVQQSLFPGIPPEIPRSTSQPRPTNPNQLELNFNAPQQNPNQLNLFAPESSVGAGSPSPQPQGTPSPQSQGTPVPQATPAFPQSPRLGTSQVLAPLLTGGRVGTIAAGSQARERGGSTTRGPTRGEEIAAFATGGLPGFVGLHTAYAAHDLATGIVRARREPIIERVNPNYPAPPCTPQDIVDAQNEILQILDARSRTEIITTIMRRQECQHEANQQPIQDAQTGTQEAISAVDAHRQAVARRQAANQQQQQRMGETRSTIDSYAGRASELYVIRGPLQGFERFTSLATSLPDSPAVLQRAKRSILKINRDSRNFLNALNQVDQSMAQQRTAQPQRERQVEENASQLSQTSEGAESSGQSLNNTMDSTRTIQSENENRITTARETGTQSERTTAQLDSQAQAHRSRAETLATSLQTWATAHRQARLDALRATQERMEQQGYTNIQVREH